MKPPPDELLDFLRFSGLPALLIDARGVIGASNEAFGRLLGVRPEALSGENLHRFISDPPEKLRRYLRFSLRSREPLFGALKLRGAGDGEIVFPFRSMIIRTGSGDRPSMIIMQQERSSQFSVLNERIRELNQRLEAQFDYRQSMTHEMKRLRLVLDELSAIVYVADMTSYRVLFVNRMCREIMGDVVGSICWQTMQSGQSGPCAFCTNDRLIDATGNPTGGLRYEFCNTRNDHWYDIHDRAIEWTDNRLVRLEIALDITERKKAQEDLQSLNEELERRVEQRTDELRTAQRQLLHREKLSAVGRLAAVVGHDLRNPLGVIKNAVFFLRSKISPDDEIVIGHLDIIDRELKMSVQILSELLELSSEVEIRTEPKDVNILLRDVLSGMSLSAGISLTLELPGEIVLPLDEAKIERVFRNLFSNALQAMGDEGELEVRSDIVGERCRITFGDRGPGIDPDNLEHIFEPFFTTRKKGIGLGLYGVREIINGHGGNVVAGNRAGGGAIFTIELPLA